MLLNTLQVKTNSIKYPPKRLHNHLEKYNQKIRQSDLIIVCRSLNDLSGRQQNKTLDLAKSINKFTFWIPNLIPLCAQRHPNTAIGTLFAPISRRGADIWVSDVLVL